MNADERYLSCFLSTRSEIVVPIIYDHLVVAEIDIDSDMPAAFGDADRELLERVRGDHRGALPGGLGHRRRRLGGAGELGGQRLTPGVW